MMSKTLSTKIYCYKTFERISYEDDQSCQIRSLGVVLINERKDHAFVKALPRLLQTFRSKLLERSIIKCPLTY